MNKIFPHEIINNILDFSNINTYWKLRFTNDVLPEIDQKFRWVGVDCHDHHELCRCPEKILCYFCYLYNDCYYNHIEYDYIPFNKIKNTCYKMIRYKYMPIDTFLYIFDKYEDASRYINLIKYQLEYYIINKNN